MISYYYDVIFTFLSHFYRHYHTKGIDTLFVQKGMENASVVYSLHKTSTRDHFARFATKNDYHIEVIAELRYDIPKTFHYHKKQSKDIQVDLLRFSHKS